MTPEKVLAHSPKVLTQEQREAYFQNGYLLLPEFLSAEWLQKLRDLSAEHIEMSRQYTKSDEKFDLEPSHTAEEPKLRRLTFPVDHHEGFREFGLKGPIVDVAEDLLGPNVCYHHSKLNYKWSGGGEEVKWHQDIHYWPHTDFAPLTIGVYLEDVDDEMGPMGIVPGSHLGPLYPLKDENGEWTGAMRDGDVANAKIDTADYLRGRAGSITIHNCCAVHGSQPNNSPRMRPLLLHTYTAGDSYSLLSIGTNGLGRYANTMVRGERPKTIEVQGRTIPIAPDYSGGYTSIFDVQQSEAATG